MRGLRKRDERDEDGFALLESLISITLITTIMAAIGMFFVTVIQNVNHNRQAQVAATLANSGIDWAHAVGAANAVSGRGQNAVDNQLSTTYLNGLATDRGSPAYTQYLDPAKWTKAWDVSVPAGSGAGAPLPTSPTVQIVNGLTYHVSYFVGKCYRGGTDLSGNCLSTRPTGSVEYVRVVVAVTWTAPRCPAWGCLSLASTLLNGVNDPLFNFNQAPPPTPSITGPPNQSANVGSLVNGIQQSGCTAPCRISASGGVPPYIFLATGLPPGLALDGAGTVSGTPTTAGDYNAYITVTDAFLSQRTTTTAWSWHIYGALSVPALANRSSLLNAPVGSLSLGTGSGGSGALAWSDPAGSLPPGLSLGCSSGGTLCITGTPTTPGDYNVTLTLTDTTSHATRTVSVVWSIGTLVVTQPPDQVGTIGYPVAVTLSAQGGTGPYTWAITGLSPATGFTPTLVGNQITGTPTATGTYLLTATITDSTGLSASGTVKIGIYGAPSLVGPGDGTQPAQATTEGLPLALPFTYTCPSGNCTLSVTATNTATNQVDSPPWLVFATPNATGSTATSTGLGSGATTAGTWSVTATITQGAGSATTPPFTLTVYTAPKFTTQPSNTQSQPGLASAPLAVAAQCANSPAGQPAGTCAKFALSVAGGSVPTWLHIDQASGAITADSTATYAQVPNLFVTATDAAGVDVVSNKFTWTVDKNPTATVADQTSVAHTRVSLSPSTSGCTAYCVVCPNPTGCTYVLSNAPAWLSVDSGTGVITANSTKFTDASATNIVLTVQDQLGISVTDTFNWTLTQPAAPTVTTMTVNSEASMEFAYPLQYTCQAPPCTFTLLQNDGVTPLTSWLGIDAKGVFSGLPTLATGSVLFKVKISDSYTNAAGQSTPQSTTSATLTITYNAFSAAQPVLWFNRTLGQCLAYDGVSAVKAGTTCTPTATDLPKYQFDFSATNGAAATIKVAGAGANQYLRWSAGNGGTLSISPTSSSWTFRTSGTTNPTRSAGSVYSTTGNGGNTTYYELRLAADGTLSTSQLSNSNPSAQTWGVFW